MSSQALINEGVIRATVTHSEQTVKGKVHHTDVSALEKRVKKLEETALTAELQNDILIIKRGI